jgi:hypothetical protein
LLSLCFGHLLDLTPAALVLSYTCSCVDVRLRVVAAAAARRRATTRSGRCCAGASTTGPTTAARTLPHSAPLGARRARICCRPTSRQSCWCVRAAAVRLCSCTCVGDGCGVHACSRVACGSRVCECVRACANQIEANIIKSNQIKSNACAGRVHPREDARVTCCACDRKAARRCGRRRRWHHGGGRVRRVCGGGGFRGRAQARWRRRHGWWPGARAAVLCRGATHVAPYDCVPVSMDAAHLVICFRSSA